MSKNRFLDTLNNTELGKLLDDVPHDLKLDIVQFGLDLAGLVNPAADAASAVLSLLRGDLLGAAISAVSIIPIGDIAKLGKFPKYRKAIARVVELAKKNPRLARALETSFKQVDELIEKALTKIGSTSDRLLVEAAQELKQIRISLASYFKHLKKLKDIAGYGAGLMARRNGKSAGQFAIQRGSRRVTANTDEVVGMLEEAIESGRHPGIRRDSKELLDRMAMSDEWKVSAGKHRKGDLGSNTQDATSHITIDIDGESYHLRMDKQGYPFQITDKSQKSIGGVPPWVSPGSAID